MLAIDLFCGDVRLCFFRRGVLRVDCGTQPAGRATLADPPACADVTIGTSTQTIEVRNQLPARICHKLPHRIDFHEHLKPGIVARLCHEQGNTGGFLMKTVLELPLSSSVTLR